MEVVDAKSLSNWLDSIMAKYVSMLKNRSDGFVLGALMTELQKKAFELDKLIEKTKQELERDD